MLKSIFILVLFLLPLTFAQDKATMLVEAARGNYMPQNTEFVQIDLFQTTHLDTVRTTNSTYIVNLAENFVHAEANRSDGETLSVNITPERTIAFVNGEKADSSLLPFLESTYLGQAPQIVRASQVIPDDYEVVSYNGYVDYGLVAGEEVALRHKPPFSSMTTSKFIFDNNELVAVLGENTLFGTTLTLYDFFGYEGYLRLNMTLYVYVEEKFELFEERRYDYKFNPQVEASLFN